MPSSIVHRYIGLDILDKLDKKPKDIINNHLNNYILYCQCTDVLYFYHIMGFGGKRIQNLGHQFHWGNVFNSFNYLINLNKENKDPELFTFIAGFLTHYKADSTMHPFINFQAQDDDKIKMYDKHFIVETYLDNYYLQKREKVDYRKYKMYKLVFNYTKEDIIIDAVEGLYKNVFNAEGVGKCYYKGVSSMKRVFKYIRYDPWKIKKQLLKLVDLNPFHVRRTRYLSYNFPLDNNDTILNLSHKEWHNNRDASIKSNKSFDDLWKDVVNNSIPIINEVYKYVFEDKKVDLYKLIGNISLSSGLPLD